jgi:hypothetical protein
MTRRIAGLVGLILTATSALAGIGGAPALASAPGPGWAINSLAQPSNFSFSDSTRCESFAEGHRCDSYTVTVTNVGSRPSTGVVRIVDKLPQALVVEQVSGKDVLGSGEVTCESPSTAMVLCEDISPIPAGDMLRLVIDVEVSSSQEEEAANFATVSGGGGAEVSTIVASGADHDTLNGPQPTFEIHDLSDEVNDPSGALDMQAGDHPSAVTTSFHFTSVVLPDASNTHFVPVQFAKNIVLDFPVGLVGNSRAASLCPESALAAGNGKTLCSSTSEIGIITFDGEGNFHTSGEEGSGTSAIYNLVPEAGYPAEFGFDYLGRGFVMYANVVSTPSGYVLRVTLPGIPKLVQPIGVTLTFFGDPELHDGNANASAAFFTNPVNCSAGPLTTKIEVDSWEEPEHWLSKSATVYPQVTGCDMLQFQPSIGVTPNTTQADEPAGYTLDVGVPQGTNVYPDLATPELKDATVTLPEGVSVSPAAADGLVGCAETGPEGIDLGNETGPGKAEEIGLDGLPHLAAGHCPPASRLGIVEIATPLLRDELKGHVYLTQPKCGGEGQRPCVEADATSGDLFGLYLEASGSGVVVKLPGKVEADPRTGRLTTKFEENPQLPFSDLKVRFSEGARALLANPPTCGVARTTSELTPWSAPGVTSAGTQVQGTPDATPFSSFTVSGCEAVQPFKPSFSAGTIMPSAGVFSPFTLTVSRSDRQQNLAGITVQTPPGLLGKLSSVPLCGELEASQGTCGGESEIGSTSLAAGSGPRPYWLSGRVYLTGAYNGGPFGLSIVVPAKAGPFNLGSVTVRAAIYIDPLTAALTIVSDPLPQIRDGVPFRLQTLSIDVNRAGFIFNPTSCEARSVAATVSAFQGASASVSSPFAAMGCARLPFSPKSSASTLGAASFRGRGASLDIKVGQVAGEANIRKVDVQLPKALPARLTTLQGACTKSQFDANPAGCPAASDVGTVTVRTPVLSVPMRGPAYLVSRGGAAFPELVLLLQGQGVRIDLHGETDIKQGITYSKFEAVPDAPIGFFELSLPEGSYSVFASPVGSLCGKSLAMPTTIQAQNGAQITRSTTIVVTGCKATVKILTKHQVGRTSLVLNIKTSERGAVTVTGGGLKKFKKTLTAGTHRVKIGLSRTGMSDRRRHKRIRVRVSLTVGKRSTGQTATVKL